MIEERKRFSISQKPTDVKDNTRMPFKKRCESSRSGEGQSQRKKTREDRQTAVPVNPGEFKLLGGKGIVTRLKKKINMRNNRGIEQ